MTTDIPADALRAVLDRFGLDGARVERSFEASTRNDNLLVASATGDQFVLRRCRRNPDVPRVEFQLRFQQYLFDSGYPTPEVLLAADGSQLVQTEAGLFTLSPFVPGDYYDYDRPAHRAEAGRKLARFHLLTESFAEPPGPYELIQPVREWWTDPKREFGALSAMFGADANEGLGYVRSRMAALHDELPLPDFDALPHGWIHNDYHGRNVLYVGDDIVALLDFDKIQQTPYALEIAGAVFTFGRTFRGSEEVRLDWVQEFLAGYEAVRPLSDAERRAIVPLMAMAQPPFVRIYDMVARDGADPLQAFHANIESMRRRRANAATLTGLL